MEEDIAAQEKLLATHRRTLRVALEQLALQGGMAYAQPGLLNQLAESRAAIGRSKAALRAWGVVVDDLPDDEAPAAPPVPAPTARGGISIGGNVGGDVAMGPMIKGSSNVTITEHTGTLLTMPIPPALLRRRLPRLPRPTGDLAGHQAELALLHSELRAGGGVWLCGNQAVLRDLLLTGLGVANMPDGALYVAGASAPATRDDLVQYLLTSFYQVDPHTTLSVAGAHTLLGGLQAAIGFDQLRLAATDLLELINILAGCAVVVAASGPQPDGVAWLREVVVG